jgi:hypothetical protein
MSDYKQDKFITKQRAYDIHIGNPATLTPYVEFGEEIVVLNESGSVQIRQELPIPLFAELNDFMLEIPKLNPVDGSVIGTMIIAEAHVAIYSAYRYFADQRDAKIIADAIVP